MDERQVRLLVVLSAAVVAIGLLYAFVPHRTADPAWSEAASVPVWTLDADKVERLVVEQPDRDRLELAREGERWRVVSPFEAPADDLRVAKALDTLAAIELGVPATGDPPEALGLGTPPRAHIEVGLQSGATLSLDVGDTAPVGWQTYVRTPDGQVVVVPGHLSPDVVTAPSSWRDPRVLVADPARIVHMELASPQGRLVLDKDAGGLWWLEGAGRASPAGVSDLAMSALSMRLDQFLENAAPGGIQDPDYVLDLRLDDGTSLQARFGDELPMGRLVQTPSGATGTLLDERLAFLRQGPSDLADRHAFPLTSDRVDRIEVSLDGRAADIQGLEGRRTGPGLSPAQALQLVEALSNARHDLRFGEPPPDALGPVSGRVRIHEGDVRVRLVELGDTVDGFRLAQDNAGGPVYRVPEVDIQRIVERLPR